MDGSPGGGASDGGVTDDSALAGIRVIELTHAIAGPQCGQILADHGADVIKVEPATGDVSRGARPYVEDESLYFACHNRGKRSVVLDLKSEPGLADLFALAAGADVLLTNYTADVPLRLGWDYAAVREVNPGLIMVHITGFGTTGPDREARAYDGIIQGMSGIPELTGPPDVPPVLVGAFLADHLAAYQATMAVLFALQRRARTGRGAFVDISMLEAYSATLAHEVGEALAGRSRPRAANRVPTAFANTFLAADGYVYLAPLGEDRWRAFSSAIGREDWIGQLDYDAAVTDRRDEAEQEVSAWCAGRSRHEVTEIMRACGVPAGPVRTVAEAGRYALDSGRDTLMQVRSPEGQSFTVPAPIARVGLTDSPRRNEVPGLGQHTDGVLGELDRMRPAPPRIRGGQT
jgi:crotonobetainyl-CoA:carnitine CoA-transferase CaiB-like acyl-CoA transferase